MDQQGGGVWLQYLQTLQEVQQEALRGYQKLWSDYASTVAGAGKDLSDRAAESLRTYLQELQAAWTSPEPQQRAAGAYQQLVEAVQGFKSDGEQRTMAAFNDLSRAAGGDAQEQSRAAGSYNDALRSVWLDTGRSEPVAKAFEGYNQSVAQWSDEVQKRVTEANQKYVQGLTVAWQENDVGAQARAAYEKYVNDAADLYRQSMERLHKSADDAIASFQKSGAPS